MERFTAVRSSLRDSMTMNAKLLNLRRDIKELPLENLKDLDVRLGEIYKKGQVLDKIYKQMKSLNTDVEIVNFEIKKIKDDTADLQKMIDKHVSNILTKIRNVEERLGIDRARCG